MVPALSERESRLIGVGAVLILLALSWRFYFAPRLDCLAAIRSETAAARELMRQVPAGSGDLKAQVQDLRTALYPVAPGKDGPLEVLSELEELARGCGVELTSKNLRPETGNGDYPIVAVDLEGRAGSGEMVRFLYNLYQAPVAFDIPRFSIRATEGSPPLEVRLTVTVHLGRGGEHEAR